MVTVTLWFPGAVSADAGSVVVIAVELTKVDGIVCPLMATVVFVVNPVPVSVSALAVLIGPPVEEMLARVGTGGLTMFKVTALDPVGFALGVLAVMLAVPVAVRSDAGTVAMSPRV